jgi:LPXTG-site transpeptidase (sortase) family protein
MKEAHEGILINISRRPAAFALWFLFLFFGLYLFLAAADALPNSPSEREAPSGLNSPNPVTQGELPTRVIAPAIDLDVRINNPTDTSITVLDEALLTGAVRYPTSAFLGQKGTVLLFGHSSYLPVVRNQNYKAFSGIQNLEEGDVIQVYAGEREYRYAVTSVKLMSAENDVVELPADGHHLALVTCNSFGLKSDRFVVRAQLIE